MPNMCVKICFLHTHHINLQSEIYCCSISLKLGRARQHGIKNMYVEECFTGSVSNSLVLQLGLELFSIPVKIRLNKVCSKRKNYNKDQYIIKINNYKVFLRWSPPFLKMRFGWLEVQGV